MNRVVVPAATERSVCSERHRGRDLGEHDRHVLRLHGHDHQPRTGDGCGVVARALDGEAVAQVGEALGTAAGHDDVGGARHPELRMPRSSDSPRRPAPRMATRLISRLL